MLLAKKENNYFKGKFYYVKESQQFSDKKNLICREGWGLGIFFLSFKCIRGFYILLSVL